MTVINLYCYNNVLIICNYRSHSKKYCHLYFQNASSGSLILNIIVNFMFESKLFLHVFDYRIYFLSKSLFFSISAEPIPQSEPLRKLKDLHMIPLQTISIPVHVNGCYDNIIGM